jgi:hypothetical protein
MKKIIISFLILAASNSWAAPPAKDVNVINTPAVTVTNPQTSVTVDNSAGNPVPVTIQGGVSVAPNPQFVGFSSDSVEGNVGLVGMHGACALTYGAGARMCIDVEVFKTPNLQASSVPSGWIQPTSQMHEDARLDDFSTCGGWAVSRSDRFGFVLSGERMNILQAQVTYPSDTAVYSSAKCDEARPVACCM